MTTNSFGGALPPFDFPPQPAPAISRMARVSKALPVVLFTTAIAGKSSHLNPRPHTSDLIITLFSSHGLQSHPGRTKASLAHGCLHGRSELGTSRAGDH